MRAQPPHLCIVDDDADLALLLARGLQRMGLRAVVSPSLATLATQVASNSPRALALDLHLSDTDSVEVLESVVACGFDGPVVLMGRSEPRMLEASQRIALAMGLNVIGVLHKPFAHRELIRLLHQAHPTPETLGEDDLDEGLANRHIRPYLQPIIDGASGAVVGAEALARWHHPDLGMIRPDKFVDLAERSQRMNDLTFAMLAQAAEHWTELADEGHRLVIAVNISASSLRDASFADRAYTVISSAGMDPTCLKLEITESVAMDTSINVARMLEGMRQRGFSLALDDFGTGHSSLVSLHRLPFAELKIDKSFVLNLPTDTDAQIIVHALVDLAHNLGQRVVAEGVENQETLDILRDFGADSLQGYFFARPLPPEAFRAWVKAYTAGNR